MTITLKVSLKVNDNAHIYPSIVDFLN